MEVDTQILDSPLAEGKLDEILDIEVELIHSYFNKAKSPKWPGLLTVYLDDPEGSKKEQCLKVELQSMPAELSQRLKMFRDLGERMFPGFYDKGLVPLAASLAVEAWMVMRDKAVESANSPRPSECDDRKEIIAVTVTAADGKLHRAATIEIERDGDGNIILGKVEKIEQSDIVLMPMLDAFFEGLATAYQEHDKNHEGGITQ